MKYVRIVVNLPAISGEFDYHLPPELEGTIRVGHLVTVPFGEQKAQGVVLQFVETPVVTQTKGVVDLLDSIPVLNPVQIDFARQLATQTLNSLAAIIELMLPSGLSQHSDVLFSLSKSYISSLSEKEGVASVLPFEQFSPLQKRLVSLLLDRGPLRGRQLERQLKHSDWRRTAQTLVKQSVLSRQAVLPPPGVRPKYILTAQLAVPPEQAESAMDSLGKTSSTLERRQKALRFLIQEPQPMAVSWVYAESGCNLSDLQELAERELIILFENEIFRDPLLKFSGQDLGKTSVLLTPEQELILRRLNQAIHSGVKGSGEPQPAFLLYGVTGSGKTEIYLRAAAEVIKQGRSVFILVPEISLTPQVVKRFLAHFPGQVGILHSKLSEGERYDTWRRARSGKLKVIIGPRSALFAPLQEPGLIVVDECHDNSYYQAEPPFYHAVRAAEMYARISGSVCILGSATPSVELRYRSLLSGERSKHLGLMNLELTKRFLTSPGGGKVGELPEVSVVDMREELKNGNRGIFSRALSERLAETLERGEQAILFLNRRGTATYVFCRDCGNVLKCPKCDTPLAHHLSFQPALPGQISAARQKNMPGLICHRCGYFRNLPSCCPACKSTHVREYGLGSEKVESELLAVLPKARSLRWDWETTREKDAHELILTHFANHRADVLVGTQMLAKGLDLPLVTLVGIVLADVGLYLPDPYASERTFQLLTQVAGRAGRSDLGGKVILQTFSPDNPVIQMAAKHDFDSFYKWEIENRRSLGYPPFARLIRLEFRHIDALKAENEARFFAKQLVHTIVVGNYSETSVIGPIPCFFSKENGFYRWQIVLRGPNPLPIVQGQVPPGWRVEVNPVNLL